MNETLDDYYKWLKGLKDGQWISPNYNTFEEVGAYVEFKGKQKRIFILRDVNYDTCLSKSDMTIDEFYEETKELTGILGWKNWQECGPCT